MTGFDSREHRRKLTELLRARRWDDALPLLEEWTRRFPRHLPGWLGRAQCLERMGRATEAMSCARSAEQLDPGDQRVVDLIARLAASLPTAVSPPRTMAPADRSGGSASAPSAAPEATELETGQSPSRTEGTVVPATALDGGRFATVVGGGVDQDAAQGPPSRADQPPHTEASAPASGGDPAPVARTLGNDSRRADAPAPSRTVAEERQPPSPPREDQWSDGTLIEGRYEVRGSVRGGMGTVTFVFDRELGVEVAVKTPSPAMLASAHGHARFLREAEAWIALGLHPNICTAFYVREIDGLPRLFIEHVGGGTLTDWLQRNPKAPLDARLDLAIQIAAGMDHAHTFAWEDEDGRRQRGVVHRDLKPSNVLLGRDGVARVTDFGLVGRETEAPEPPPEGEADEGPSSTIPHPAATGGDSVWRTVTVGGTAMGTPPYMAPEQWTGAHAAGPAADIYAFGCVLYEIFCGRRPFALDPAMSNAAPAAQRLLWERLHRDQPAPHPRDLSPELDLALAELLHACLRKEPERRPPSFAQLGVRLRDLHRRLLGRPSARPEPTVGELLADSLSNRGVSYMFLGRRRHAERAWRSAVETDPGHVGARFNLALYEWLHLGGSDDELVRTLEELRSAGETGWRDHLLAGRALLRLGRFHDAVGRLRLAADHPEHAPEVARDFAAALVALAADSGEDGLWQRATDLLRHEGGTLRSDPRMLVCYAFASLRSGNAAAAERLYQEARRFAPELPDKLESAAEELLPTVLMAGRLSPSCTRVGFLSVTPDGRIGLAGGESRILTIWDLRRSEPVRLLEHQEGARVRSAALTPDGQHCLSAAEGDAVAVWNIANGATTGRLQLHSGLLAALALSHDGRLAAGVGSAGTLFTWDAASGRRLVALKTHPGNATALALDRDGRRAVVGGADGRVVVVDLDAGSESTSFAAHDGAVTAVAIDSRTARLVTAGENGDLRTWAADGGEPLRTLHGHRGAVRGLALDADGARCLSAGADRTLRVWDLDSGEPLLAVSRDEPITAVAASADWAQVLLAVGDEVHRPRLHGVRADPPTWALAVPVTSSEAAERGQRFQSRIDTVRNLMSSERFDKALAAVESARSVAGYTRAREAVDLSARIASLFPREGLRDGWQERVLDAHEGEVVSAAIAGYGQRALSGGRDRRIVVWSWPEGGREAVLATPSVPLALCFLAGNRQIASADLDGVVRLWDLEEGDLLQQLGGHEARVNALALDPLGRTAVSASDDGTARVWDPSTGGCRHVLRGHLGRVLSAAVGPDGRLALTGGDDGSLLLWDVVSGRSIGELKGHAQAVLDLDWSSDGRFALSVGDEGSVRLWEIERKRSLRVLDEGLDGPRRAALTPDGRFALIGVKSGRLALWELRSRSCQRTFEGHTDAVTSVAIDRAGRRALSASTDGSARIWYLDWRPQVRPFAEWDDAARPHLEVFLAQQVPQVGSGRLRPEWNEHDVERLLRDLGNRGFGWLRPDGVRRRLTEMGAAWGIQERPAVSTRVEPTSRIAATPHARLQRRVWIRRAAIAAAIALPLVLLASHLLGRRDLRLDSAQTQARRARNMAVLLVPVQMAKPGPCDPGRLDIYIRDFTDIAGRPGDIGRAVYCLQELADPRAVPPVLDMVRPPPADDQPDLGIGSDPRAIRRAVTAAMTGGLPIPELVASTLARLGDPAVPALEKALSDRNGEVRSAAAAALALGASAASDDALRRAAESPAPEVRLAVAEALPIAVVAGPITVDEGFGLAERFAGDPDPHVRAAAARGLRFFAGARARLLLEKLAGDDDQGVRAAAARSMN